MVHQDAEEGVFLHLAGKAAFLDKVEFALWGVRRARISPTVVVKPSIAIGGANRPYARSLHGKCRATDNPFELRYGRIQSWPKLSPLRLIGRSNSVVLTGSQMTLIAQSLLRQGFRAQVQLVELTFDTQEIPIPYFRLHFLTRCRNFHDLRDDRGRETIYIGSRRSPWQLRIYQKTSGIVRLEYILRREFLVAHGIRYSEDLLQLRTLNLENLVCFPEFDHPRLNAFMNVTPNFWGKDLVKQSPQRWPIQTLASVLRWRGGIDPASLLRHSEADHLLGCMQQNLLW
jgi:hypothetical protein